MDGTRTERRLTTIMAADVVGYSRLVEADEAGTLTALRRLRQGMLEPLLVQDAEGLCAGSPYPPQA